MVLNNGFGGQCTAVLLYGEGLVQAALQGSRNSLRRLHADRLSLYSVIYRPERNSRRIGDTGPCEGVFLQERDKINLCRGVGAPGPTPLFPQGGIEGIEMISPEVFQLDMTDDGINPLCQFPIAYNGAVFGPPGLFRLQNIITICLECLAAVRCDPRPAFLLKGRCKVSGLFSCALFCPGGRHVKGGRPGLQLLPVWPPATVDTDRIRD